MMREATLASLFPSSLGRVTPRDGASQTTADVCGALLYRHRHKRGALQMNRDSRLRYSKPLRLAPLSFVLLAGCAAKPPPPPDGMGQLKQSNASVPPEALERQDKRVRMNCLRQGLIDGSDKYRECYQAGIAKGIQKQDLQL